MIPITRGSLAAGILFALLVCLAPVVAAGSESAYLAIVIDDLGHSRQELRAILALPGPVAGAVLPHAPHSRVTAEALYREGRDVLLHLPMEPIDEREAGPGALTRGMTPREIALTVDYDLTTVPHAIGVNNHMGSLLTQDRDSMQILMRHLEQQGNLFFLDSLTSAQSIAHDVATQSALPMMVRDVFLDNDRSNEAIREQLARAVTQARRHGSAVAIGHPYPETLAVLNEQLPTLAQQGVDLVSISDLLMHKTASVRESRVDRRMPEQR